MKQRLNKSHYLPLSIIFLLLTTLLILTDPARAAIALVGSSTNGGNITTLGITTPVGTAVDDFMLAQIAIRGNSGVAITAPGGWTLLSRQTSANTVSQAIYYKVATATEPASYSWTFSKRRASGCIISYSGVDILTTPIDVSSSQANGSSTSVTAPTITTSIDNAMLVGFFGTALGTSFSGVPAGMAQVSTQTTGAGNKNLTTMAAGESWVTAGATGTRTAITAKKAANVGHLVALKPSTLVLDHFHVEVFGGGLIPDQTIGLPFYIQITAHTSIETIFTEFIGTVNITSTGTLSSGGGATASFVDGVLASHGVTISNLGIFTITATDPVTTKTGTSNSFEVIPQTPVKLQILVPGETAAPGTPTGKTGVPIAQSDGVSFNIIVNAVDINWNVVTSATDTVTITSSDPIATLPADIALVAGTITLAVELFTTPSATITASDVTVPSITADTSPSIFISPVLGVFNAFESSTSGGAVVGLLKTKIAGTSFTLDIIALNGAGTAVVTNYKKWVTIQLMDSSDNSGAIDANGCRSSWTSIQTLSPNIKFDPADLGRRTVSFQENNSWPDVRVRINETGKNKIGCSNDNFAIRPDSFTGVVVQDSNWETAGTTRDLNNIAASGGVIHKAGRPFTIRATALNSLGNITTNYTGVPNANIITYLQPLGGISGILSSVTAAVAGVLNSNAATYTEIGSFTMQLEDQTFANVDAPDSSTAQRYFNASAINVGRFVPDNFLVTAMNVPVFKTFNDTLCATRSFTYIGQPFGYTTPPQVLVAARDFAGNTTANYTGSLWNIIPANVTQTYSNAQAAFTESTGLPTVFDNGDGTGTVTSNSSDTLTFTRDDPDLVTPENPFNADISLSVSVIDNSEADGNITSTPAVFNGGGPGIAFDSGNELRFGSLAPLNGFGPENEPLSMEIFAEYYDSISEWSDNFADNCTSFTYIKSETADMMVTQAPASPLTLSNGLATLTLTPVVPGGDGGDPGGVVGITYSGLQDWHGYASGSAQVEAKFGIYRGNDRIINWQEILR